MTTSAIRTASLARRERQKAETRQAILDAARELFVSEGVEATTMRAIAAKIGYTPTAIYHHFRDKDALIVELCMADFSALGQAMYSIGRIDDPVERVKRMGLAYTHFALENPSQYRFMFMTSLAHNMIDAHGQLLKTPDEDAYQFLFQTVKEGIDRVSIAPNSPIPSNSPRCSGAPFTASSPSGSPTAATRTSCCATHGKSCPPCVMP